MMRTARQGESSIGILKDLHRSKSSLLLGLGISIEEGLWKTLWEGPSWELAQSWWYGQTWRASGWAFIQRPWLKVRGSPYYCSKHLARHSISDQWLKNMNCANCDDDDNWCCHWWWQFCASILCMPFFGYLGQPKLAKSATKNTNFSSFCIPSLHRQVCCEVDQRYWG